MTSIPLSELQSSPIRQVRHGQRPIDRTDHEPRQARQYEPVIGQVKTFSERRRDVRVGHHDRTGRRRGRCALGQRWQVSCPPRARASRCCPPSARPCERPGPRASMSADGSPCATRAWAKPSRARRPKLYVAQYEPPAPLAGTIPADDLFAS